MKKVNSILLIDDSIATNMRNKEILKDLNITENILDFNNGEEAIKYLKSCKDCSFPKLIFLDITMPEMNGFEFIEKYIANEVEKDSDFETIIVIVSDYLDFENFEKAKLYKSYGVLEHIKKPMDPEDVSNLLEEYFE